MRKIFIGSSVLLCFSVLAVGFSASAAQTKNKPFVRLEEKSFTPSSKETKEKLMNTLTKPPGETHPGKSISKYDLFAREDQKYKLYCIDDVNREKVIGTLETISGNGFIYPIKRMTLEQAEGCWGKSRDRVVYTKYPEKKTNMSRMTHRRDSPTLMKNGDLSRRIFDLVALGQDNQPKIFHVTLMFIGKNGLSNLYTVDGPGIRNIRFKRISEKEEE